MLDSVVAAETPEGILLELRPAGLSARFAAFLVDELICLAILFGASIVLTVLGNFGTGLWLILVFVIHWFYPVIFELGRTGATPGKRVMGLKVIMDNGLPITPAASITRNLMRFADAMPFLFGFGIACVLLRADGKQLAELFNRNKKAIEDAIHKCKQNLPRNAAERNPDVVVDKVSGEVYPLLKNGRLGDSIGNILDALAGG